MPRSTKTNLNKEDYTVPDSSTVLKHGDNIYYIDAQSSQGRFGKCIKAWPAFGPEAQRVKIHWIGQNHSEDCFISVKDPSIRVRRQVAAQLLCEGDDRPAMDQLTAPQAPKQRRATADVSDDELINFADRVCNWGDSEIIDYPVEKEDARKEDRPKHRLRQTATRARATATAEVARAAVAAAGADDADDAMEVDGAGAVGTLETAPGTAPASSVGLLSQSMQAHASCLASATSDASGGSSAVPSSAGASTSQAAEAAMRAATPTVEVATAEAVRAVEVVFDGGTRGTPGKRGWRNPARRGRQRGNIEKKGGFTLHLKSEIRKELGDDAVPRLAGTRQGELPLSLCWEETLHTIFFRLGMATQLGLKRVDFHEMYDPYVYTPDDFVVEWSRARGVMLHDTTSLLCKSPGGREVALAALTGPRLFAVRARITGDAFDAPHVFFFDAERRHLMTNWHTSRVVEFDDDDATSALAARFAIKHLDFAFLHDKRIKIQQLYEASLMTNWPPSPPPP